MKKYPVASVAFFAAVLVSLPSNAATFTPSADSRAETDANGPGPTAATTSDLAVGPVSAGRSFRTYLTYDLSSLTVADTAQGVTLDLFNIGSESNTSSLPQVYTLFHVASDWDGALQPGPSGTALATFNITPSLGNDTNDIQFASAALTTAFNNAIGGNLYLGILSDLENADARSFTWFGSSEDAGLEPLLTSVVPEPTSAALILLGGGVLLGAGRRFRRA